ncbi:MAG TPA: TlpA disulfide reductase family protein [Gemmatimonadales bacterium]|nr:TlpA disulfide reductase family protein [Gemmatimonadales bacterium]
MFVLLALLAAPFPTGDWRSTLDLAGGELHFDLRVDGKSGALTGRLCNGGECLPFSTVRVTADSIVFEMADFAATIKAAWSADSMVGVYHNVGVKGPRTIPFRASRGRWPASTAPAALLGSWDAILINDFGTSPRVLQFRQGPQGLEGIVLSNSGDYGLFSGEFAADSFKLMHFDGSFVFMFTGELRSDTLRGTFHAGLKTETPFVAVRSTGKPHLTPPTEVTHADTVAPFRFSYPDLSGKIVSNDDPQFRGKVLLVDLFGTWCSTCHDAAPTLVQLYRDYHSKGLEIVGLGYEVSGDSAVDLPLIRRYREKFHIPFTLLLAGRNDVAAVQAAQPQLTGFTAFPTTLFIGRDGRVREVHAGFYGPSTGALHDAAVRGFRQEIERLLRER